MVISERAPAKINLALHVLGRRPDGYHLLDSVVAFADFGDLIDVSLSSDAKVPRTTLSVTGQFGAELLAMTEGSENLVLTAAKRFYPEIAADITLTKMLPIASGIGGGSADAAAVLRALARATGAPLPTIDELAALGADVPVCLDGHPARMQGIGEVLSEVQNLPEFGLLLVNTGFALPTAQVFDRLRGPDNPPLPELPGLGATRQDWLTWLATCRNDLEGPAITLRPEIAGLLSKLRALPACRLARMSGSGATCFALFDSASEAKAAKAKLAPSLPPSAWIEAGVIRRSDA